MNRSWTLYTQPDGCGTLGPGQSLRLHPRPRLSTTACPTCYCNLRLYKKQYQQPIEEETPPHKGKSKTATTSDSRKRSTHKHIYKKIILHYGSDSFAWGRQCEICGRVDSTYKSSYWNSKEFQVTGEGLYGEWRSICLTEIHRRYPEYSIMTLENAKWVEWTGEDNKEEKTEDCCAKRV